VVIFMPQGLWGLVRRIGEHERGHAVS